MTDTNEKKAEEALPPRVRRLVDADKARTTDQRLNIYTCTECRGHIVTKDVDEGVTPFMISCEAKIDCLGAMESSFYRVWDQRIAPSHHWYKPGPAEHAALIPGYREHVDKGGLLLRRADGQPTFTDRRLAVRKRASI